jgi:Soluble lytic murein transglycosylase and related regulatory proteins (some contain LysM/invasin domains)
MTQSHRLSVLVFILIPLAILTSCAQSKVDQFGMPFVPATPNSMNAKAAAASLEPPQIPPKLLLKETPATLGEPAIQMPSYSAVVRRADTHFQEGKRLYQAGDREGARREFDRAIDILLEAPEATDRTLLEKKVDELVRSIYRYDVDGLGAGVSQEEAPFEKSPLDALLEMTFPVDPKLKDKVSEEVRATVSQLPLEVNDAVLSYINYFSSERGRRIVIAGLKRSGRYRNMISRILDEEGVPQELIHLAQAESGFMPRAVSRKAATGMWQFVSWRAREYGLAQTPYSDERLDPEKATRAAARHLRDLHAQFGDWYLALAAYNCGPGCVERAVARTGYADFWELRARRVLPKETRNYVPAILALTIISKNLRDYGIDEIEYDASIDYDTIDITAPTNLALVADVADSSVAELRELNPALLKPIAPAGYALHVPKGTAPTVMAALEDIPPTQRISWRMHRVESGETLEAIAKRYNTPLSAIESANGNLLEAPEEGDMLIIPAAYKPSIVSSSNEGKRTTTKTTTKKTVKSTKRAATGKTAASKSASRKTKPTAYRKGSSLASR